MNSLKNKVRPLIFLFLLLFAGCSGNSQENSNNSSTQSDTVIKADSFKISPQIFARYQSIKNIPLPAGYERIIVDSNSFGFYMRNLELKTDNNIVYLYDGSEKSFQNLHFAVIKMDAGTRDLQQCADAVMRLRGEYLWYAKKYKEIHFNFLGDGKPRFYTEYAGSDRSYKKFRKYMDYIFSYANTSSLKDELKKKNLKEIMPGDVFIQKGNPYGHAVIVTDVAENKKTGERIFMVAQSYMPAQEIHILINPDFPNISPWYKNDFKTVLHTPQWDFGPDDLMTF